MAEAAANESSMEDILSSIRKIIADDEVKNSIATEKLDTPVSPHSAPDMTEPKSESGAVTAGENMENQTKQPSLAEIAANVKAGVMHTKNINSGEVSVREASATDAPSVVADEPIQPQAAEAGNPEEASSMKLSEIVAKMAAYKSDQEIISEYAEETAAKTAESEDAIVETAFEPAPSVVQPEETLQTELITSQANESSEESSEAQDFKTALMSPSSDDAVSSSFERLKRSAMDDMDAKTEAILRPMLREWLDENLPTMVERLVREEIERVSRGV